jgi:hypothetical protein
MFRAPIRRFGRQGANSASGDTHLSFSRSAFVPERKMNNRWRSEIEPNDPLAQGSEARATFCSAKRLEDVKTTGKMKNIDAGMVPGTCQQSSPDPSPASDRSIALRLENEKPPAGHCRWFWRFIVK